MVKAEYLLLNDDYLNWFVSKFKKQPQCIPTDFTPNRNLPQGVEQKEDYSRMWIQNSKAKKPS